MLFVPLRDQTVALSLYQVTRELDVPLVTQLVHALANVSNLEISRQVKEMSEFSLDCLFSHSVLRWRLLQSHKGIAGS